MGSTTLTPVSAPFALKFRDAIIRYWMLILAFGLLIFNHREMMPYYWKIWNEPESYYSHAILVPFIAGFMVWKNRERLRQCDMHSNWLGIPLILAGVGLFLCGMAVSWMPLISASIFLFIYGILLSFLGWQATRVLFWPVLFIATMIPLSGWQLDFATGRFQLISTTVAAKIFGMTGVEIIQEGNQITSGALPEPLLVGVPCSGLRLLISLITFGWFFAYIVAGPLWKKGTLVAIALPLSILVNAIRIAMIGYVGIATYSADAMHSFHDYSGYISLVICFVILFGFAKLIGMRDFEEFAPREGVTSPIWGIRPLGTSIVGALAILLLLVSVCGGFFVSGLYDLPKGKIAREDVPRKFAAWRSQETAIDDNTLEKLAKGDLLSMVYVNPTMPDRGIAVFLDAALDIDAFHDPHVCLPGGGQRIMREEKRTIHFNKPRPIDVNASVLYTTDDYGAQGIVIYWYMLGEDSYPETLKDLQTLSFSLRVHDLKRLLLNPFSLPDVKHDILARQLVWYRFSIDGSDPVNDERLLTRFVEHYIANTRNFGVSLSNKDVGL